MKWGFAILGVLVLLMVLLQVTTVFAPDAAPSALHTAGSSAARAMPSDWIREDQVRVYPDRVVIEIPDAVWARFTPTHSMDPVLGDTAHALQIVPQRADQISVGDIISFWNEGVEGIVIHRVIDIGSDENGWFAVTKGDNNPDADPGVRRFGDISRVLVAVIY